jgi:hypothetical protein
METKSQERFADKAKRKARNFFRWFIAILLIVLVATGLFLVYGTFSEGVRAGTVIKVSKRGTLFKTYEGQMNMETFGAIKNSGNLLNEAFLFSVRDEAVIKELEAVSLSGERVNLRYEEKYLALPFFGETKYFVTDVERVSEQ